MRIISKFHDYYDSAMAHGQDRNLIYRREPSVHVFDSRLVSPRIPEALSLRPGYYLFKPKLAVLGFCAHIYPIWIRPDVELTIDALARDRADKITMSNEEVLSGDFSSDRFSKVSLARLNSLVATEIGAELFLRVKAPIFLATGSWRWHSSFPIRVLANPRLATLNFMKTLDPFSAFQEISMFLGMQLTGEDQAPRTVGGDEVIAASKGFDKLSFRTQAPGNKKANRKTNKLRKHGSNSDGD